jgi:glycosyltransferase involved in cell wall biosynthesis
VSPARVLFLSSCVRGGGAGWSLFYLLKHLDRRRVEPLLVVPSRGCFADRFSALGVEVVELPRITERTGQQRFAADNAATKAASYLLNALSTLGAVGPLRRLIRERRVDLVHCNNMLVKTPGALVAQSAGVPCVLHVRNLHESLPGRLYYGSLARLPAVRRVIANSEASAVPFRRVAPAKVTVVPNGVDLAEWDPSRFPRGAFRAEAGLPPEDLLVGFTGNLIPRKGIDVLVRAAARVLEGRRGVTFAAVGRVPVGAPEDYLASCTDLARRLGIGERFRFAGFRADVRPAVRDFDVLVLPSLQEPFGRSIIEAMALGAPVVASRVGGVPEIIGDGREGLLVAPGSAEELAAAIGRLLDAPGLRADLARRARERVEREFDVVRLTRRVEDLLLEACGGADAAPGAAGAR